MPHIIKKHKANYEMIFFFGIWKKLKLKNGSPKTKYGPCSSQTVKITWSISVLKPLFYFFPWLADICRGRLKNIFQILFQRLEDMLKGKVRNTLNKQQFNFRKLWFVFVWSYLYTIYTMLKHRLYLCKIFVSTRDITTYIHTYIIRKTKIQRANFIVY